MKKDSERAIETMIGAIKYMIAEEIRKAPFDKTKNGRIIQLPVGRINTFEVEVDGVKYRLKKYGEGKVEKDQIVKVVVPQNDMSNAFFYTI